MQKDNPINKMKDIYLLSKQTNKQILNIIKIKNKNYEKKMLFEESEKENNKKYNKKYNKKNISIMKYNI